MWGLISLRFVWYHLVVLHEQMQWRFVLFDLAAGTLSCRLVKGARWGNVAILVADRDDA